MNHDESNESDDMTADTGQPRQVLLALVNPVEGREEEFRTWYWDTHIPEVLKLDGFVSAQRYRAGAEAADSTSHRYGTIYEVEGSAAAALHLLFGAGVGMSPDLDLSTMVFVPFAAEGQPVLA